MGHTGGIDGFHSMAGYFPEEDVTVALLENGVDLELNEVMKGVLSFYFGRKYKMPVFESIPLSQEEQKKYLGTYSAPDFPLKISILKSNKGLRAQANGQSDFPLTCTAKDQFEFSPANIKIKFLSAQPLSFDFQQNGAHYKFTKD